MADKFIYCSILAALVLLPATSWSKSTGNGNSYKIYKIHPSTDLTNATDISNSADNYIPANATTKLTVTFPSGNAYCVNVTNDTSHEEYIPAESETEMQSFLSWSPPAGISKSPC